MNVVKGKKFCSECQRNKSRNIINRKAKSSTVGEFHKQALTRLHALSEVYHRFGFSSESEKKCFEEIDDLFKFYSDKDRAGPEDLKIYSDFKSKLKNEVGKEKISRRVEINKFISEIIGRYE